MIQDTSMPRNIFIFDPILFWLWWDTGESNSSTRLWRRGFFDDFLPLSRARRDYIGGRVLGRLSVLAESHPLYFHCEILAERVRPRHWSALHSGMLFAMHCDLFLAFILSHLIIISSRTENDCISCTTVLSISIRLLRSLRRRYRAM